MKGNSKAKTPKEYFDSLSEPRKSEIIQLDKIVRKVTGLKPAIYYGMLGYGKYHYKYATGREGDWYSVFLASQKNYISLYACMGEKGKYVAETFKSKLPKASIGKSCVRFKRLENVDLKIIEQLLKENHRVYRQQYRGK